MVTLYSVRRSKLLLVTTNGRGVVSELVKSKGSLPVKSVPLMVTAVPVWTTTGVMALRSVFSGRFREILWLVSSILAYRVTPPVVTAKEVTRLSGSPVSMMMRHVSLNAVYLVP